MVMALIFFSLAVLNFYYSYQNNKKGYKYIAAINGFESGFALAFAIYFLIQ